MKLLIKTSFLLFTMALFVSCSNKPSGADAKTGDAVGNPAQSSANAKQYKVSNQSSKILWTGSKPTKNHTGTVDISEGTLAVDGNNIVSGSFKLDMNTITVTDLKPEEGKAKLEGHLKGTVSEKADDFFNVGKFPTGSFVITKVEPVSGNPSATHRITGDLTLRDITKSITFDASVAMTGNKLSAVTPAFKIDRTQWGVNYGSKSIFDNLADNFVNDEIALVINIDATL